VVVVLVLVVSVESVVAVLGLVALVESVAVLVLVPAHLTRTLEQCLDQYVWRMYHWRRTRTAPGWSLQWGAAMRIGGEGGQKHHVKCDTDSNGHQRK
jgi:hypothetical protein